MFTYGNKENGRVKPCFSAFRFPTNDERAPKIYLIFAYLITVLIAQKLEDILNTIARKAQEIFLTFTLVETDL